jgi:hypothetical protein
MRERLKPRCLGPRIGATEEPAAKGVNFSKWHTRCLSTVPGR